MKRVLCAIFLVNVILNVDPGFAYNCYECQEEMGKGLACEINVGLVLTPNCTQSFQCIKYIWTTNGTSIIYRGCAPRSKCSELSATASANHTLTYCGVCDSPLCNSGFAPSYIATVILTVLSFISFRTVL